MRAAELWESAGVQEEAAPAENEAETSEETVLSENEAETSEEAVLSENEAGTSEEAVLSENEAMIPEETVATGYETETQDEMITSEEEAVTEDTVGAGDTESFTLKTTKLVHVNPLYREEESVEPEESLVGSDDGPMPDRVANIDDLVEKVHGSALSRTKEFSILIDVTVTGESQEEMQASFDAADAEVKKAAVEALFGHTGVPVEGDYIYYQTGGYTIKPRLYGNLEADGDDWRQSVSYDFVLDFYTTADQESELDNYIGEIATALDQGAYSNLGPFNSDYDKALLIQKVIAQQVEYDYENLNNLEYNLKYTAYNAWIEGKAVCQGYAVLFYRICLAAGIDCRVIAGDAGESGQEERHAWNIVRLGRKYYYVDVAWDDNGEECYANWFLKGKDMEKHTRDESLYDAEFDSIYPMSDSDYEYTYLDTVSDRQPSFMKYSLSIGSKIGAHFYLKLPYIEGVDYSTSYIDISIGGAQKRTVRQKYSKGHSNEDGMLYGFSFYVTSIEMADSIHAEFYYYENGTLKSCIRDTSITDYFEKYENWWSSMVSEGKTTVEEDACLELIQSLYDYGYHVSNYLSRLRGWTVGDTENGHALTTSTIWHEYNIGDEEVNAAREELDRVGHAEKDYGTSNIEKATYALRLDSATSIYTYFKPVSGYTGSFSAKVYKGDVAVSCKVKKMSDGRYRVIIPNIPAYNLSDSYTIKATTDGGTATFSMSPFTYANDLMTNYIDDPIVIKAMVSLYYYANKAWYCKYGIGVN